MFFSAGILNRPNFQTRVTLSLVQCNLANLLRLLSPPWPATTTTGDTAATVTPPPTSRRRTSLADTLLLVLTMARDSSHRTSAKFWYFFTPYPLDTFWPTTLPPPKCGRPMWMSPKFFIWERESTNIAKILIGDDSIVNCLQGLD